MITIADIVKNLFEKEREQHKDLIKECLRREEELVNVMSEEVKNLKLLFGIKNVDC